jgi:hypothetical protein
MVALSTKTFDLIHRLSSSDELIAALLLWTLVQ